MPTYEYACKECGEHVEVQQSFTDDPLTTCEKCGGPLRKVFGSIGVTFKGSGFYRTDSRAGSATKKAEKTEKTDKADKADKKSDGDGGSSKDSGTKESTTSKAGSDSTSSTKPEAKTA